MMEAYTLVLIAGGFIASLAAMLFILKNYSGRPVNFVQDAYSNIPLFALISLLSIPAGLCIMLPIQILKFVWKIIFEVIPPGEKL